MSEAPPSLGDRLKAERERRGLSAAKAADQLHLDGWVIDALEAEDYERVGPSVYAKGHLKRYAALLGLPADEILASYESREQAPRVTAAPAANVRLTTEPPAVSNLPWPPILGVAAVLLLVVGVLWWKPWHDRGSTRAAIVAPSIPAPAPSAAAPAATTSAPPAAPLPVGPSSAVATPVPAPPLAHVVAGTADTATEAPVAGAGRARLRLSFSADSWVDVRDAAGHRTFAGKGRANSVKVLHGVAPMRVYLGFASGVQLEINDRAVAIKPQFVAGNEARFEAGADGVLRRDSHPALPNSRPTG
jgi:cytoskeleton protein RodZ